MPEVPQEIANRGGGDSMTQPADLARDALVAPPRLLAGEPKDQLANNRSAAPAVPFASPDDRRWPNAGGQELGANR